MIFRYENIFLVSIIEKVTSGKLEYHYYQMVGIFWLFEYLKSKFASGSNQILKQRCSKQKYKCQKRIMNKNINQMLLQNNSLFHLYFFSCHKIKY